MNPLQAALDEYMTALSRFVVFADPHQPLIAALYAASTFTVDEWWQAPYLNITSPEADSGKSTLLKVLRHLVYEPVLVASVSPAWIYRKLSEGGATLMIDEFDNLMGSDQELHAALSGILNVGYDREVSKIGRTSGRRHEPVEFDCFGFKVLCGIGKPSPVVRTRMLAVQLQRALPGELAESYDPSDGHIDYLVGVRESMEHALENTEVSTERPQDVPVGVANRLLQLWRPLLAVADAAGGSFPELARQAASWSIGDRPDTAAPILRDVSWVLENDSELRLSITSAGRGEIVPTESLLAALKRAPDSPWGGDGRKSALGARRLGTLLGGYGVHLGERVGSGNDKTPRGASLMQLEQVLRRYRPVPLTVSGKPPNVVPSGPRAGKDHVEMDGGPDRTGYDPSLGTVSEEPTYPSSDGFDDWLDDIDDRPVPCS